MDFKIINQDNQLEEYRIGLNEAFLHRSNDKIPYFELPIDSLKCDNLNVYGVFKESKIVAGGALELNGDHCTICHVWTAPDQQNQGIGSYLMKNLEQEAINMNFDYILLNVACIYKPACQLYKKNGYKKFSKYAYIPKTHHSIEMIKVLNKGSVKSVPIHYLISSIKYFLLFKNESTPRLLHKIIFK